jgi:hypothetical protein
MRTVRDDPDNPDPGFAELYAQLPDAIDLYPWLDWARAAAGPVLYLGVGAGRLAVPLAEAGIQLVGVDSHPGMLAATRARLPGMELHRSRIEALDLGQKFELVIVPSNILCTRLRLERAARHLTSSGRLGFELTNPHWLAGGTGKGVRITQMDRKRASFEVDYQPVDGQVYTQEAKDVPLIWPEEIEAWIALEGLALEKLLGWPDRELAASPTFYVLARRSLD